MTRNAALETKTVHIEHSILKDNCVTYMQMVAATDADNTTHDRYLGSSPVRSSATDIVNPTNDRSFVFMPNNDSITSNRDIVSSLVQSPPFVATKTTPRRYLFC